MIREVFIVRNKLGLHGRAAGKFIRIASRFKSDIRLSRAGENTTVDGKSILEILTLAAREGTALLMTIQGEDEQQAMEALQALINSHFGEA